MVASFRACSVCYRLYPKRVYERMARHQLPELLRLPLEQTIVLVRTKRLTTSHLEGKC